MPHNSIKRDNKIQEFQNLNLNFILLRCTYRCMHAGTSQNQYAPTFSKLGAQVKINKIFECNIVNIFLPNSFDICFGAQKNSLIEIILLSTHNI